MKKFLLNLVNPVTIYCAVIGAIIAICVGLGTVGSYITCKSYGSMTDRETRHSIVSGCYVKTEHGFIPRDELSKRVIAAGVE